MHMPGHKRSAEQLPRDLPWALDVTEVGAFDNLYAPEGILADAQALSASLWGSGQAFFLVGGSTAGILSAIRAYTKPGDRILVARNCHMSVFHAIELCGLSAVYMDLPIIQPFAVFGSLQLDALDEVLRHEPEIRLAVVTSPTYDGVLSNIRAIAERLHRCGIPLIVDEAHGPHLYFYEAADVKQAALALNSGADAVVHSLHKTLPSLTQTGVLHVRDDEAKGREVLRQLMIFQSSSPSYPLMASIDHCCRLMAERGSELAAVHADRLKYFYQEAAGFRQLRLMQLYDAEEVFCADRSRLLIYTGASGKNGGWLAERLSRAYQIEVEQVTGSHILALSTMYDSEKNIHLLLQALREIDQTLSLRAKTYEGTQRDIYQETSLPLPKESIPISEVVMRAACFVSPEEGIGRLSAEYVWCYPPGVPVLIPGQRISDEFTAWLSDQQARQVSVKSSSGELPERLQVLL